MRTAQCLSAKLIVSGQAKVLVEGVVRLGLHVNAALSRLLDELGDGPGARRPALVRGDSGYGNEGILLELEARNQPYLLRQRIRGGIARQGRVDGKQLRLDLAGPSVHEGDRLWE